MKNLKKRDIKLLVSELKEGNERAFKALYQHFHMKLYHYILQYVKSIHASEELVQEVFIKIWLKRSKLKEQKDFSSFLYVMTRNMIYDHLRQLASRNKLHQTYFEFQELLTYKTSDDVQLKEYERFLDNIVQKLSKQKQKIYILSTKEGKNDHEIAEILGISSKTVKNNLWEILKIIKEQLRLTT
ncbi:MAG: sigma-70 family RNA polymerase sigma factor [Flavobacteriaceae bacterium]|nr:sigma-70 family RNA polymerase sigma factor [Flavobacteriaceae bacterium]MCY4266461.1 sigma-70 family RNA polymerase sigma factor [Flavobacteriaceae bacterium]MCY4298136.1 sigma-70 family RNA polymerase sigma factor [Flavobacteriaceae bacterium]